VQLEPFDVLSHRHIGLHVGQPHEGRLRWSPPVARLIVIRPRRSRWLAQVRAPAVHAAVVPRVKTGDGYPKEPHAQHSRKMRPQQLQTYLHQLLLGPNRSIIGPTPCNLPKVSVFDLYRYGSSYFTVMVRPTRVP